MNREIIFRGKRVDSGEWVFGNLVVDTDGGANYIVERAYWNCAETRDETLYYEVYPETAGQFTGLKDKNGNKIFERDLIQWSEMQPTSYDYDIEELVTEDYVVEFVNGMFVAKCLEQRFPTHELLTNFDLNEGKLAEIEIIGNIHEVNNETTM